MSMNKFPTSSRKLNRHPSTKNYTCQNLHKTFTDFANDISAISSAESRKEHLNVTLMKHQKLFYASQIERLITKLNKFNRKCKQYEKQVQFLKKQLEAANTYERRRSSSSSSCQLLQKICVTKKSDLSMISQIQQKLKEHYFESIRKIEQANIGTVLQKEKLQSKIQSLQCQIQSMQVDHNTKIIQMRNEGDKISSQKKHLQQRIQYLSIYVKQLEQKVDRVSEKSGVYEKVDAQSYKQENALLRSFIMKQKQAQQKARSLQQTLAKQKRNSGEVALSHEKEKQELITKIDQLTLTQEKQTKSFNQKFKYLSNDYKIRTQSLQKYYNQKLVQRNKKIKQLQLVIQSIKNRNDLRSSQMKGQHEIKLSESIIHYEQAIKKNQIQTKCNLRSSQVQFQKMQQSLKKDIQMKSSKIKQLYSALQGIKSRQQTALKQIQKLRADRNKLISQIQNCYQNNNNLIHKVQKMQKQLQEKDTMMKSKIQQLEVKYTVSRLQCSPEQPQNQYTTNPQQQLQLKQKQQKIKSLQQQLLSLKINNQKALKGVQQFYQRLIAKQKQDNLQYNKQLQQSNKKYQQDNKKQVQQIMTQIHQLTKSLTQKQIQYQKLALQLQKNKQYTQLISQQYTQKYNKSKQEYERVINQTFAKSEQLEIKVYRYQCQSEQYTSKIASLQNKTRELQDKISFMEQDLRFKNSENSLLSDQIIQLNAQNKKANRELVQSQKRFITLQHEKTAIIDELNFRLNQAQIGIKSSQQTIKAADYKLSNLMQQNQEKDKIITELSQKINKLIILNNQAIKQQITQNGRQIMFKSCQKVNQLIVQCKNSQAKSIQQRNNFYRSQICEINKQHEQEVMSLKLLLNQALTRLQCESKNFNEHMQRWKKIYQNAIIFDKLLQEERNKILQSTNSKKRIQQQLMNLQRSYSFNQNSNAVKIKPHTLIKEQKIVFNKNLQNVEINKSIQVNQQKQSSDEKSIVYQKPDFSEQKSIKQKEMKKQKRSLKKGSQNNSYLANVNQVIEHQRMKLDDQVIKSVLSSPFNESCSEAKQSFIIDGSVWSAQIPDQQRQSNIEDSLEQKKVNSYSHQQASQEQDQNVKNNLKEEGSKSFVEK